MIEKSSLIKKERHSTKLVLQCLWVNTVVTTIIHSAMFMGEQ